MTLDQALAKLRQTPRDWRVNEGGVIRRTQVTVHGPGRREHDQCPLAAITGEYAHSVLASSHAEDLKMTVNTALRIILAADYATPVDEDVRHTVFRTTKITHHTLRARILAACGLS